MAALQTLLQNERDLEKYTSNSGGTWLISDSPSRACLI
jgi:hypothetical protein